MSSSTDNTPGRILGIGGIFFKSPNRDQLSNWYREKMGIDQGQYGMTFKWRSMDEPAKENITIWSIFPSSADYFAPSSASFMINYIVDDLAGSLGFTIRTGIRSSCGNLAQTASGPHFNLRPEFGIVEGLRRIPDSGSGLGEYFGCNSSFFNFIRRTYKGNIR